MSVIHEFPATAAGSLVEGYCSDFSELATTLTQTLQQVESRKLSISRNRRSLERAVAGLRTLAELIERVLVQQPAPAQENREPGQAEEEPASEQIKVRVPPAEEGAPFAAAVAAAAAAADAAAESPMHGSSNTMPILAVFQFLGRRRKTGTLTVEMQGERLGFEFGDGCVVRTSTTRSEDAERIGDLLVERRFVTLEQIKPFIGRIGHLGGACVDARLITNGQLMEILEMQVLRRFERVVKAADVTYTFKEGRSSASDGRIRIRPFELLFECRRQV